MNETLLSIFIHSIVALERPDLIIPSRLEELSTPNPKCRKVHMLLNEKLTMESWSQKLGLFFTKEKDTS